MSTKITLDANALRYLLQTFGDDFAFELKRGVIAEFSRSYKIMLTESSMKLIRQAIESEFNEKFMSEFGVWQCGLNKKEFVLNDEMKNIIANKVKSEMASANLENYIDESIDSKLDEVRSAIETRTQQMYENIKQIIGDKLDRKLTGSVVKYIDEEVDRRLNSAIKLFSKEK
jgi:hypothetical protein